MKIPKNIYYLDEKDGFESSSAPVFLSEEKMRNNIKPIRYLYGQLKNIHTDTYKITPISAAKKYTEEQWTQNGRNFICFIDISIC